MFSAKTYIERRKKLCEIIGHGRILLFGNDEVGMNYPGNTYHFRQDSTFLYFIGVDRPGLVAIIDATNGETTLYGHEATMDDIIWTGPVPTLAEQAELAGIQHATSIRQLTKDLVSYTTIHHLPPYRSTNVMKLHDLTGIRVNSAKSNASRQLVDAVVKLRSIKSAEEVEEIERAVRITNEMHLAAMKVARPGMTEAQVYAKIREVVHSHDTEVSFPAIVTVRGETLHNHHHHNTLESGQMLLVDCGAEAKSHYAGDMTRTFPVDRTFTSVQKDVYNIVLDAMNTAIAALRPGVLYRDVHLMAARVIAEGMKGMGLMKGDVDEAVALGAHAMFFQHGLGHMMGLDVHDMEDLGENHVGYTDELERSPQFGLGFLRLARALEPGFVLTVEPGIYFIPQLIDMWKAENKFGDFLNYEAIEKFKGFGGIRIEEDFLITENGSKMFGEQVPKTVEAIEALRA